ncbi:hypothetical protein QTO34_001046 [Cnephaeus nilssonii]|uniref:MHC class I-like antigen recognition-like domain-containing protein n=1 Tax=Cnephaeus nilssonii TaxID=3371016 RepID=A0AA40HVB7_CNENI|nr:hypothetical protein QTO34_001046 [Eptesicus nilssonii]
MVGIACSKSILVLLVLTVLPDLSWAVDCLCMEGEMGEWCFGSFYSNSNPHQHFSFTDSNSFHYNFKISSNEQPWCTVQGEMDKVKYFSYDCGSNKVISMSLLREAGKAMDSCKGMPNTMSNVGNELKSLLPDIKQEKYAYGAPFTLQVRMTCQRKADGGTCGFLEFFLDGQRFLTFDPETEKYRVDNSVGERLKKKWENDKDLTKFFKITLKGDCQELYQCWVHWKIEPETTAASPTATAADRSKATTNTPIAWIYPVILTCAIIVGILGGSLQLQLLRAGLSGE